MAKTSNVTKLEQAPIDARPSSIVVHTFKLRSLSPLLMHNPAGMREEQKGKGVAVKTIPPAAEEAEAAAYRMEDGNLGLPVDMIRMSLLEGCLGRRIGKMSAQRVIAASVMPLELAMVPLIHPDTGEPISEYKVDIRRVVVQKNGIRRARPRIDQWAVDVQFEIDLEFCTVAIVTELLNIAGRVAGVGDYRVNRKGTFGRYRTV